MSRRTDRQGVPDPIRIGLLEADIDLIEKAVREGLAKIERTQEEMRDAWEKDRNQSRQIQIGILVALMSVLLGLAGNLAYLANQ